MTWTLLDQSSLYLSSATIKHRLQSIQPLLPINRRLSMPSSMDLWQKPLKERRSSRMLQKILSCGSGENAIAPTESEWPTSVFCKSPVAASQSLIVSSQDPDAICLPSGENAIASTVPEMAGGQFL
ncbi:hypothetical protein DL95DRAFT_399563 [Leptodontidium sp. 2 PMI_412]|nr:hypothetical protein DL95DRAFT_399563 [Leptodontidium sp. 2 PMI_412]